MADVTEITSRFRLVGFHLALVLDVFSRMPLAWKIFYFQPRHDGWLHYSSPP